MVEGFRKIDVTAAGIRIDIDLITEPELLGFRKVGEGIQLFYKNKSLQIDPCDEAKSKLRNAINALFNEIYHIPNRKENPVLKLILDFVIKKRYNLSLKRIKNFHLP